MITESYFNSLKQPDIPIILEKIGDITKESMQYNIILYCYFALCIKKNNSIFDTNSLLANIKGNANLSLLTIDELADYINYENDNFFINVKKVAAEYSEEQLATIILCADPNSGYIRTPDCIFDLVNKLLLLNDGEKVVNTAGGYFDYLTRSMIKNPNCLYYGEDTDYSTRVLINLRADVIGGDNYNPNFPYDSEFLFDKGFTSSFEFDALGMEYDEVFSKDYWKELNPYDSIAWTEAIRLIDMLKDDGRGATIIDGSDLTKKRSRRMREFLIKNGHIEGVIALPRKMYESKKTNPFLVIFSKENKSIKFLDARFIVTKDRENGKVINTISDSQIDEILDKYNNPDCAAVSVQDVINNESVLSPLRYIEDSSIKEYAYLGDVIKSLKRGATISATESDSVISEYCGPCEEICIKASSIENGLIVKNYYILCQWSEYLNNRAYPGNILINKNGFPFKIAMSDSYYVVVGNIYILDIDSTKINPTYVKCFLESHAGQSELRKLASEGKMPIITVDNLKKVRIPIRELSQQAELEKKVEALSEEICECNKKIMASKQEIERLFE